MHKDIVKDLKELARVSEVADVMFKHWANRDRSARGGVSEIKAIAREVDRPVKDVVEVLKTLESKHIGMIKKTKTGRPNKWEWEYTLRSVGGAVCGSTKLSAYEQRAKPLPKLTSETFTQGSIAATDCKLIIKRDDFLFEVSGPLEEDKIRRVIELMNSL